MADVNDKLAELGAAFASMQTIGTGAEVRRIKGEAYQIGALGTVVDVHGDRLRVYWHTNPRPTTKPKRTWVNRSVVQLA